MKLTKPSKAKLSHAERMDKKADAYREKEQLYGKMADDLRGQAAQIRYRLKYGNPNQPKAGAQA